jgi:hypothetical protein
MSSVASSRVWTPSKTITIGMVETAKRMEAALIAGGCEVWWDAKDLLQKIPYASSDQEINLVFVSNEDLGIKEERVLLCDTVNAAFDQGLKWCEAEDGPALAAQYRRQVDHPSIWVAMDPAIGSFGRPRMFTISWQGKNRTLGTMQNDLDGGYVIGDGKYAFRCP